MTFLGVADNFMPDTYVPGTDGIDWNSIASAEAMSAFCGIMAGFVLAGLVTVIGQRNPEGGDGHVQFTGRTRRGHTQKGRPSAETIRSSRGLPPRSMKARRDEHRSYQDGASRNRGQNQLRDADHAGRGELFDR